jgi:hypothetical protein
MSPKLPKELKGFKGDRMWFQNGGPTTFGRLGKCESLDGERYKTMKYWDEYIDALPWWQQTPPQP